MNLPNSVHKFALDIASSVTKAMAESTEATLVVKLIIEDDTAICTFTRNGKEVMRTDKVTG